jgi:hypothetical protein
VGVWFRLAIMDSQSSLSNLVMGLRWLKITNNFAFNLVHVVTKPGFKY